MRNKWHSLILLTCISFTIGSCKSYEAQQNDLKDTPDRGTLHISADESFKPIIDAQVLVYESNHPGTHLLVDYKPEADCLKDIWNDSVGMIITTRLFSDGEQRYIADSMKTIIRQATLARDAVAVIVNPSAADSVFSMTDIKELLTGKFKKNLIPVFDGVKATSSVRYIVDSVLQGSSLTSAAVAARSSDSVIKYVAATPNAVGFIGVSWIGNRDDSSQVSFLKKVKIAYLQSTYEADKYLLPVQRNIYNKAYPMVRDLVYLLKENYRGLGRGFGEFMEEEIGQLIFKRAYLAPLMRSFNLRPIQLNE